MPDRDGLRVEIARLLEEESVAERAGGFFDGLFLRVSKGADIAAAQHERKSAFFSESAYFFRVCSRFGA